MLSSQQVTSVTTQFIITLVIRSDADTMTTADVLVDGCSIQQRSQVHFVLFLTVIRYFFHLFRLGFTTTHFLGFKPPCFTNISVHCYTVFLSRRPPPKVPANTTIATVTAAATTTADFVQLASFPWSKVRLNLQKDSLEKGRNL